MKSILFVLIACVATGCAGNGEGGDRAGGGSAGNVIVPDAELCGGAPCADHSGERQFTHDSAPDGVDSLFGDATRNPAGTNAANEPAIVYPSNETMFPVNVSRIRFEWTEPAPDLAYELRFEGDETHVSIFTTGDSWAPTEEEWDWVAESNRGGAVTFTVSALDPSDAAQAWTSNTIDVFFSDAAVPGAIYYWSTGTSGVMRARIEDSISQKFYTDPEAADAGECVACHTVSRDGRRMAMGYGGEALRTIDIDTLDVVTPTPGQAERKVGWSTFSPDGELLLVSEKGVLRLLETATGEPVGDDDGVVPLPDGKKANMPDWSGLGDKVAFAMTSKDKVGNKDIEAASIAVIEYDNGAWGDVEVLVPSAGGEDNNFFPAWSPDSAWIAYVNAQGKSKDAVSATIRLVSANGGLPQALTRLNERVNDEEPVTGIGNAMPRWAPSTLPGTFWLAFSSLRAYATLRPEDDKEDQIWIAAIDPAASGDLSYPAFWAPFQSIDDGNHRAFWTVSEEDRQQQCLCVDVCGDGIDNDCSGFADDDCSECGPVEICNDGIDNNCNCVVDECVQEICDDLIDNDGDGLADEADPSCIIVD